ncbi:MAG: porin [Ideonella sp.]|nr:porin [Ideonella sp.]
MLLLGATYQYTDALHFTGGFIHDRSKVDTVAADGKRTAYYGVVDYYFSKRTDVYAICGLSIAARAH